MYVDWNSSALCDFGLLLALLLAQVPMVANDRLKISHTIQILSLTLDCSYFQCSFHKKFMNTLNIIFCICFCLQLCYWMIPIRFCLKGEKSHMILISCKKKIFDFHWITIMLGIVFTFEYPALGATIVLFHLMLFGCFCYQCIWIISPMHAHVW